MYVSKEAEELLQEILDNEEVSDYWRARFNSLNKKEDVILRGCFKELQDAELIKVTWADNIPYYLQVLKNGYFYKSKQDEKKLMIEEQKNSIYDVFLSHANVDKLDFVDDLNSSLQKLGINIFYDKNSLEWGDNQKQRILEGVQKATFAIIVISNNFFDREWTEKELYEFLSRQTVEGQKLILPIIHNISHEDLSKKYPSVSNIQAISSKSYNSDEIALLFAGQLIKRLKSK